MSDEQVNEEQVGEQKTSREQIEREVVEQVVREYRRASLKDILQLPALRRTQAIPYVIPGTDLEVLIAPASYTDVYKASVSTIKASKIEDTNEQLDALEANAIGLLKACILEPEMTDEAIEALRNYSQFGFSALVKACREISGIAGVSEADNLEGFT